MEPGKDSLILPLSREFASAYNYLEAEVPLDAYFKI
jgi:hypothetical protein